MNVAILAWSFISDSAAVNDSYEYLQLFAPSKAPPVRLTCVALPCCLFDLACYFLPSFSSLIKTCMTPFGKSLNTYSHRLAPRKTTFHLAYKHASSYHSDSIRILTMVYGSGARFQSIGVYFPIVYKW